MSARENMAEPRYVDLGMIGSIRATGCEDCGAILFSKRAHTRFHSILGANAWALAVLKTAHVGPNVHDRYSVVDRINSKTFDSWSGEAFTEVVAAPAVDGSNEPPAHNQQDPS